MAPEISALVRRHGLSTSALAELEALWVQRSTAGTITLAIGADFLLALARRHGWSDAVLTELNALWAEGPSPPQVASKGAAPRPGASTLQPLELEALPVWPAQTESADRYEDLGLIGQGGMGEVRRVRDRVLNRVMAMKIMRAPLLTHPEAMARFLLEVQATAQLQHPGIIPVHDLGRLPDGRLWFTMQEARGRTLAEVIAEVHAVSGVDWETTERGWSLRRLVSAFHSAVLAVAFAHDRAVIHRDLKPANVIVGQHGEVYVLDWGLAKVLGQADLAASAGERDAVQVSRPAALITRLGQVAGTPAYMSPEQARGEIDQVDARSDVYAMGTMLYEVLCGRVPEQGTGAAALRQVVVGPPRPAELVAACERAMARDPQDRFPNAAALAEVVQEWLDGARRREQALMVVARAGAKRPEAKELRARAASLRREASALLEGVEPWRPVAAKAPGWAKQDAAQVLERQAALAEVEEEQLLQAALTHAPELVEAHAALAARYRQEQASLEEARGDASRPETLLRHHVAQLPSLVAERGGYLSWLEGVGALTLETDPPGAEVQLFRYEVEDRRWVPRFERVLGRTPLRAVPLPRGSYLCLLVHPERATVRYPVSIGRQEHWDGRAPGASASTPIVLPRADDLGPDDCYVPAGWYWSGGDASAPQGLPRRHLWVDGLVVRRFPVSNGEFLGFLNQQVAEGRADLALRCAPRHRPGTASELGALIYSFDGDRFALRSDSDGDAWDPRWPVIMVDWHAAVACAAAAAARDGRGWRLPSELEWEKAARGVDARYFPWGDWLDPCWTCILDSHRGPRMPVTVDAYPEDESVYGVRGLSGNVRDWCADPYTPDGPVVVEGRVQVPVLEPDSSGSPDAGFRVVRGGCWVGTEADARAAYRYGVISYGRYQVQGFRLISSISDYLMSK